jgi:hypothetical protein
MIRSHSRRSTSRSLIFVLTLLLLLGHACELPAFAEVFAHTHESAHDSPPHHSPDHHGDDDQVSCDALVGIRSSTSASPGVSPNPDAREALSVATVVPSRNAAAPPRESSGVPRWLPLFLLHASLLI